MLQPDDLATLGLHAPLAAPAPRRASNISQALRAIRPHEVGKAPKAGLVVRPVRHRWELEEVYRITHDAYLERGYCAPHPDGRLVHYPALEGTPETTVLVAMEGNTVMGTVSLTIDGACGLNVDHDFPAEVRGVRAEGRALGAVWRLATRATQRGERRVVMALIQAVVRLAFETQELATFLIVVNPRHQSAYARLLDMQTVAFSPGTDGLDNAPGVLMRCDLERCPERWLSAAPCLQP